MESIEKLREFVSKGSRTQITTLPPIDQVTLDWRDLTKLIDEIEEEFKEQEQAHSFAYSQVYEFANNLKGQLLDFDKMDEQQEAMAEHGWYRALCADREPMLLGDRMEWANGTFTIHELKFTEGGCTTWDSEHGYTVHADECRHHREPTVEDVLREFTDAILEWAGKSGSVAEVGTWSDVAAEYAKKLRLANNEE